MDLTYFSYFNFNFGYEYKIFYRYVFDEYLNNKQFGHRYNDQQVASGNPTESFTSTSTSPPPYTPTKMIGSYTAIGCYTESTKGRALYGKSLTDGVNMSNEFCASLCTGFSMFGTEYGKECKFMSNFVRP